MAGFARWADYGHVWLTWWLGDAAGDLIVAPVLVLWSTVPPLRRNKRWLLEAAALLAGLSLVSLIVFDGFIPIAGIERLRAFRVENVEKDKGLHQFAQIARAGEPGDRAARSAFHGGNAASWAAGRLVAAR